MLTLIWIGIIVIVIIIFIKVIEKPKLRQSSQREIIASGKRDLFTIQIGDIIVYQTEEWCVEERIVYNASGYHWFEYLLLNEDQIRWLSVEQDDLIEVLWLKPINNLDISTKPPKTLNFEGESYKCVESGKATINKQGKNNIPTSEACTYYDYESENDRVLSVEIWDNEVEIMVGEIINPRSIEIFPGDGQAIYGN